MPKFINYYREKPHELVEAEDAARKTLFEYFLKQHGRQKQMALATGIPQPLLSRMAKNPKASIALEAAIAIEVASGGELKAEKLCPARAELVEQFMAGRNSEK